MKTLEFKSRLDCVCQGIEMTFFSNAVEIFVQQNVQPKTDRKSVKIPYVQIVKQKKCCVPLDMIVAILFLCR